MSTDSIETSEREAIEPIEREIQRKGLTAPRVTTSDIEANIGSEHYFTAFDGAMHQGEHAKYAGDFEVPKTMEALGLLTFCVLVLRNGFTVTGESACASPENFDAELGRKIARANAINKVWPLMGYALKDRLAGPTDEQVSRFLAWHLPAAFAPDGGISFEHQSLPSWPTGTNLLNAEQAKQMLAHVLT